MNRRRVAAAVAGAAVLAVVGGLCVAHRATYASWPWDGPPMSIEWCGRTYARGDDLRRFPGREIDLALMHRVKRVPPLAGHWIYSTVPRERERPSVRAGVACDTVVPMEVGRDEYVLYALLGGP